MAVKVADPQAAPPPLIVAVGYGLMLTTKASAAVGQPPFVTFAL